MFEDENSQLCRLCLKSGDCLIDIFQPKGTNGLLVWEIIKELIGIETSHSDGSPPTICEDCMRKLMEFKYFKKMCINSKIEFLMRQINNGLVVPVRVDESGPLREDLHCQGYLHARGSWSNVGAEGIKSEVPTGVDESGPLREDLHCQGDIQAWSTMSNVGADGIKSEVTGVNITDGVSVPVDEGGGREGNSEKTLTRKRDSNRLIGAGHQGSVREQHYEVVPVATHSQLKERRLSSDSRNENNGPDEGVESTPQSTAGKQFRERNGEHTQRSEAVTTESKHGNGGLAGNNLIGSSVGDEKSEGQDFMCDEYGKGFRAKDLNERHVKVPCGTKFINCGTCKTMFHSRNEYELHKSLHCGSDVSDGRAQRVRVDMRGESECQRHIQKRMPPACHICNKIFSDNSHLKRHVKTVHLKKRNFSCGICGKAFGVKGALRKHMRCHSGVKPYTCSHCRRGFNQSGNLRQHIRAVHEMEKPHTCGECGKAFSQKAHLKKHILSHTRERPHTCGICSETFTHKHHLESHRLIHTGEQPPTCNVCSKTFRHNRNLKRHLATHARQVPHR